MDDPMEYFRSKVIAANPESFESPLFCLDKPLEGGAAIQFIKNIVGIGEGRYYLSEVKTDGFGNDTYGNPIQNRLKNKCVFVFNKLKP